MHILNQLEQNLRKQASRVTASRIVTQAGSVEFKRVKIILDKLPADIVADIKKFENKPVFIYAGATNPPGADPYKPELPWFDIDELCNIFATRDIAFVGRKGVKLQYEVLGFTVDEIKYMITCLTKDNFKRSSRSDKHPGQDADVYIVRNWKDYSHLEAYKMAKITNSNKPLYLKFFVNNQKNLVCLVSFHLSN